MCVCCVSSMRRDVDRRAYEHTSLNMEQNTVQKLSHCSYNMKSNVPLCSSLPTYLNSVCANAYSLK